MAKPLELDAYLRRINYAGPRTPTYDALTGILQAHIASIPFESFDVLLGRPIRLDPEGLQAKIVTAHRGGYCFEHASLMHAALEAIGFAPTRHASRVLLFEPRNESVSVLGCWTAWARQRRTPSPIGSRPSGSALADDLVAIFLHLEPLSGVSVYVARERGLSLQKTITPASVAQPYPGATAGGGNSQNISFNGIMTGTTTFFNQFAAQIARTQQQYAQLNPSLA